MPVTITRVPDEPIVVAHLYDRLDRATVRCMFEATAAIACECDGPVVRVENFHDVDVTFRQMATALVEANRLLPGSGRDPRVQSVVVAGRNRVRLLVNAMGRIEFGSRVVPVFDTLEEGLAHARLLVQERSAFAAV